ncbi:DUF1624 domain-containing protein [Spirosoma flavum]|uniref:DUF1624 domain-containing protein n=1 Tax=Spirosoma flavum TaxID=2048557 RepID=A0ABW6AFH2_9BACT
MQDILYKQADSMGVSQRTARLIPIDSLRGLIIILMALDHVRDFWSSFPYRPDDVSQTSVFLFLTRWVTHFCAPTFVFLAGISIFLYQQKQTDKRAVSLFLLKRGVWMIFLELVIINFLWQFSYHVVFIQVIWVIGWSMVSMALLIWLPRWSLLVITLVLIGGHQLLSTIEPQQLTVNTLGWVFFHKPALFLSLGDGLPPLFAVYPLIPWVAVMLAGYLIGAWFINSPEYRKRHLRWLGWGLLLFFVILRATNVYGDPHPWSVQNRGLIYSALSFINVSKYPPSLLYLCLTLGVACLLLATLEGVQSRASQLLMVFGKVPLFFYLLHIPLINAGAMVWTYIAFGRPVNFFFAPSKSWPSTYEPHLWRTYVVWIIVLTGLYVACRWYGRYKQTHSSWWLTYL